MFLPHLYKRSKLLFVLMALFIVSQLLIGYKHGMVISPFYNYGMYSEVFKINNSYEVWEVEQNGKLLRGEDFSPQEWDKILLPVQYYASINSSNDLYQSEVKRLLSKMHLAAKDEHFLQQCNYSSFENWYRNYVSNVTHQNVTTLAIRQRLYNFDGSKLIPTTSVTPLAALCR